MPTVDGRGYLKWDDFPVFDGPAGNVALTIDGYTIQGALAPWSSSWNPPGSRILMADGTYVHQYSLPKPTQPTTMQARTGRFEIMISHQQDLIRLHRAAQRVAPVLVFLGEFHEDQWSRANGASSQTSWRTSRRLGWNGTTRTHATHPPYAEIDGVSQTIITSGTPIANQVKVPTAQTANQFYDTITTPALTSGEYLVLRYWPEWMVMLQIVNSIGSSGVYQVTVDLQEYLFGEYV